MNFNKCNTYRTSFGKTLIDTNVFFLETETIKEVFFSLLGFLIFVFIRFLS